MGSIRDDIVAQLATIAPSVQTQAIDAIVTREIDKRANALVIVLDRLNGLESDLRKIDRADDIKYDKDGKIASEVYTKSRVDEIKKLKEKIGKHSNAINKALGDKSDFADVYNIANNKPGGGDKGGDQEATE